MSDIYLYESDATELDGMGLVGALTPTECTFSEEANGLSELQLVHPLDDWGRYRQLVVGRILKAPVPVRSLPEIENGQIVTKVEYWQVKSGAPKSVRWAYSRESGGCRTGLPKPLQRVTVVKKGGARYKIKYTKIDGRGRKSSAAGWVDKAALEYISAQDIGSDPSAIEEAAPAWSVREQFFRIYSVRSSDMSGGGGGTSAGRGVTVYARHIFYDLMGNLTVYKPDGEVSCQTALDGILAGCVSGHDFKAVTNIGDRRAAKWVRVNPVSAMLEPEEGAAALYGGELVRDNWDIALLNRAGMNRGVRIEYRKNMLGVECQTDMDSVVTRVYPMGQSANGKPLGMGGSAPWVDSPRIGDYPTPHVFVLDKGSEIKAKSTSGSDVSAARNRLRQAAQDYFKENPDIDLPGISLSVDFVLLGDTAEYARFRDLESVHLYDTVRVRHAPMGIDILANVNKITFDCLNGRMKGVELGNRLVNLAQEKVPAWQLPGDINGHKLLSGTIGAGQLADGAVGSENMASGAVSADKIQDGAVGADKLHVGDMTNLLIDPGFENSDLSKQQYVTTTEQARTGKKSLKIGAGITNWLSLNLRHQPLEVKKNERLYVEWWAMRAGGDKPINISIRIDGYDGQVTYNIPGRISAPPDAPDGQWIRYSYVATCDRDGVALIRAGYDSAQTMTGDWYMDDVLVRRVVTALDNGNSVEISPENGIVVTQGGLKTQFRANARQFGVYDGNNVMLAGAGYDANTKKGYFATRQMRNTSKNSDFYVEMDDGSSVGAEGLSFYHKGVRFGGIYAGYFVLPDGGEQRFMEINTDYDVSFRSDGSIGYSASAHEFSGGSIISQNHVRPEGNGTANCGLPNNRWRYIYSQNQLNVSSDARVKRDIAPIENAKALIMGLRPRQYRLRSEGENAKGVSAAEERTAENGAAAASDARNMNEEKQLAAQASRANAEGVSAAAPAERTAENGAASGNDVQNDFQQKQLAAQSSRANAEDGHAAAPAERTALHTGFVAQHVKRLAPDWAAVDDSDPDNLGMMYGEILAPLVQVVQDQQREIEELQRRVRALEGEREKK